MLAALERGVKGGKWFSLMDKVWKMENLQSAVERWCAIKERREWTGKAARLYPQRSPERLPRLQDKAQTRNVPTQTRQTGMDTKAGKQRTAAAGSTPVEDRVVETALRNVLEPIFEHTFAEHSYGFRPGRGAKQALRRVDQLLKTGHHWVVDADLKGYFDSIPQDKLMAAVETQVADGAVLELIRQMLETGRHGKRQRMATDRNRHAARSESSVRYWQTFTSTRWTI